MKKRTKWVLLALIAVVAIILMIALLRGCQQDPDNAANPGDSDEMPMDVSPLTPGEASAENAETQEHQPNIDPESGVELEEDELPIVPD